MDIAIGAEFARLPGAVEIEMGDAFRGKGITEDRIEQAHVKIAHGLGLPLGMGEVLECAGEIEGVACAVNARAETRRSELSVADERVRSSDGLEVAVDRLWRRLCFADVERRGPG